MQEKIKSFLEKGKQRWTSAGKKVKILLVAALVVLVAAIAVAVVLSQNKTYVTLFTELNQSDMSGIVTYLSDNGVTDYQIKDDSTILVPEEQEESFQAKLVESTNGRAVMRTYGEVYYGKCGGKLILL